MTDTWTTGGGVSTDTTVVNQTSAGVYTVYHASDASSITTDVPISGSSFYYWSCNGGGTYSQSDESACQTGWFDTTWNLDLSTNPYTAKGTAQGFNQLGTLLASGTFTAYFVPATKPDKYEVSGTVYGQHCGKFCVRSPLADQDVLVTGKTATGESFSDVGTSSGSAGDLGQWSVQAPPGRYTAGPTDDDKTFAGPAFDPETRSVGVTDADVPKQNFTVCTEPQGKDDPALRLVGSGSSAASHRLAPQLGAGAVASGVDQCISDYTVTIKASISQPMLVDPSPLAHFNVDGDLQTGFNDSAKWYTGYVPRSELRQIAALSPEFPECAEEAQLRKALEKGWAVKSYSYITAGLGAGGVRGVLGGLRVPMQWNQDTGKLTLLRGLQLVPGYLTRHFGYVLVTKPAIGLGTQQTKLLTCEVTNRVPVLAIPVAGGDDPGLSSAVGLGKGDFAIVLTWGFPFDLPGLTIDSESSLSQKAATLASEVYEGFEHLDPGAKFLIEFAVSYFLAGKVLGLLAGGAESLASWATAGDALDVAEAVEQIATIEKWVHRAHSAYEWLGFLGSAVWGKNETPDAYPVMGAVVRGNFYTEWQTGAVKRFEATLLSMSVATTRFPNITLTVARSAANTTQQFNGLLPVNPGGNAKIHKYANAYYDTSYYVNVNNLHYFQGGAAAVKALRAVIGRTQYKPSEPFAKSDREYGGPAGLFTQELALAPPPVCSKDGHPVSTTQTICWLIEDGLP